MECWHCFKRGHIASECWVKDAEMDAYRASKGKSNGKGDGWKGQGKGQGGKSKGKGKGNWYGGGSWYGGAVKGGGTGAYWFDQPHQGPAGDDRTWAFSLTSTPTTTSTTTRTDFEIPKKTAAIAGPPGLSPSISTSNTWALFREAETEADYSEDKCTTAKDHKAILKEKEKPKKMTQAKFQTKSQMKKKIQEENKVMNQAMKENQRVEKLEANR